LGFYADAIESSKNIDWKSFFIAVSFGYILSIFPLGIYYWKSIMNGNVNASADVFNRAEIYLIFSIIAFSSVGNLLSNADRLTFSVITACSINILFGIFMFGFFSEFDSLKNENDIVINNLIYFGKWCWLFSLCIFAASHIKTRKA